MHGQPLLCGFHGAPFQSRDRQGADPATQLCVRLTRSTHKNTPDPALVPEGRRSVARGASPWTTASSNNKAPEGRQAAASMGRAPPTNAPDPGNCARPALPCSHFGCSVAPMGLGCSADGIPGAYAPGYQPWLLRSRNTEHRKRPQHREQPQHLERPQYAERPQYRHHLQRLLIHRTPGKSVAVGLRIANGRFLRIPRRFSTQSPVAAVSDSAILNWRLVTVY